MTVDGERGERIAEIQARIKPPPRSLDEWGPTCRGCGGDEFRIDGYCSIACRDYHEDEDVEWLLSQLARVSREAEQLRAEVDRQLGRHLCYTSDYSRERFWRAVDAALAEAAPAEAHKDAVLTAWCEANGMTRAEFDAEVDKRVPEHKAAMERAFEAAPAEEPAG